MILSIAALGLLFLCPSLLWAYRRGLKDGLALNKGAPTIEPIPTPVQYLAQDAKARGHEPARVARVHAFAEDFHLQDAADHAAQVGRALPPVFVNTVQIGKR